MARDAEKAQSTLNRLLQAKQGAPSSAPPLTVGRPHWLLSFLRSAQTSSTQ